MSSIELSICQAGLLGNNKMYSGYYNHLRECIPSIINNKISDMLGS